MFRTTLCKALEQIFFIKKAISTHRDTATLECVVQQQGLPHTVQGAFHDEPVVLLRFGHLVGRI